MCVMSCRCAGDWHVLHRRDSGGSTGSNGEGISLLRIGSITLPSSMDLRQYLEQMQAGLPSFTTHTED